MKTGKLFRGELIGTQIIFLESTSSTNDVAAELCRTEANPGGTVIIADEQRNGRGRQGGKWISPPGVNLYFSIILTPPEPVSCITLLTLSAAVAVATAIRQHTGLAAEIKWPNDILIKGKKTGGILVESRFSGTHINYIVTGIGINVNMSPESLPPDLREVSTSLAAEGGLPVDRWSLLNHLLEKIEHFYRILLKNNTETVINQWLELNCTTGKKISLRLQKRIITGIADGIDHAGRLTVRLQNGNRETFSSGEVTLLKS